MEDCPKTLQEGHKYLNRTIKKFFPSNDPTTGGTVGYVGKVTAVTDDLLDENGENLQCLYFHIEYEDGDEEDMSWEDLATVLLEEPQKSSSKRSADETTNHDEHTNDIGKKRRPPTWIDDAAGDHQASPKGKYYCHGPTGAPQQESRAPATEAPYGPEEPEEEDHSLVVRTRGRAGHLKRISLQNFMCHANFQMEFGMHVNVVSGTNGSGKSAVMQGLQVTLGATARATGRASALHELIKTGAHEAIVKVTLWNTGEGAYQPLVYGQSITVERKIRPKGGGFRLLNHAGSKVSTRKEDLQALVDHLSLCATNPLTVMTQDDSRAFLSGSAGAPKKFQFFMQATMLQDVNEHLSSAEALMGELLGIYRVHAEEHKQNAAKLAGLEKQLEQLEAADAMSGLQDAYDLALHRVLEQELWREVEAHRAEVHAYREDIAKVEAVLRKGEGTLQELRAREAMLKEELRVEGERIQEAAGSVAGLKRAVQRAQAVVRRRRGEVAELVREVAEAEGQQQGLLDSLRDSDRAEVAAQKQAEMAEYRDQLKRLTDARDAADAAEEACNKRLWEVKDALAAKQPEAGPLRGNQEQCAQEVAALEGALQELQASCRSRVGRFGGKAVVALQRKVAGDRRFGKQPIGPIGAYLQLTDANYSMAVEAAIGWCLDAWICDSHQDAALLRKLAGQHHVRISSIITSRFETPLYNVPPGCLPPPHLTTVLGLLSCEPEHRATITNVLIDHAKVESTVLTGPEGGRELAYNRPRNVRRIFEQSGSQWRSTAACVTFIPNRDNVVPRLGANVSSQIQMTQSRLAAVREAAEQASQQVASLNKEITQLEAQSQEAQDALTAATNHLSAAKAQLNTLQSSQQPTLPEDDTAYANEEQRQLDAATAEVRCLQVELVTVRAHLVQAEKDEEAVRNALLEARHLARSDAGATAQLREQLIETGHQMWRSEEQQVEYRRMLEVDRSKEEEAGRLAEEKEGQLKECQGMIAANADLAQLWRQQGQLIDKVRAEERRKVQLLLEKRQVREGGPAPGTPEFDEQLEERVRLAMTVEHLKRSRTKLMQDIQHLEQVNGGSLDSVREQHQALKPEVQAKRRWLDDVAMMYRGLSQRVAARRRDYGQLFHVVQETVNNKFNKYMARRRHQGHMHISREKQELRLEVRVGGMDNHRAKPVTDLKTLSGGERSYTTMAFLLALGENVESPFRCMDEFDVFMDAVNRRIATQTLLEFAMEHNEMQYIFLTPQSLQAVDDARKHLEQRKQVQLPDGFLRVVRIQPARDR